MIGRAKLVEHLDDAVAPQVCSITHGRAPVAILNSGVLVDQIGVLHYEFSHRVEIVAPDRVDEFAGLDHSRPAGRAVTSRECQLSIGQRGILRRNWFWVMLIEFLEGGRIATTDIAEKILRLVLELIEVGTDRKVTTGSLSRHDEPP